AGHTEVKARPRPPVQLQPEMFAVAADTEHAAAQERLAKFARRHGVVDDGIVRAPHAGDPTPCRHAAHETSRRLDLRELWHRPGRREAPSRSRAAPHRRAAWPRA